MCQYVRIEKNATKLESGIFTTSVVPTAVNLNDFQILRSAVESRDNWCIWAPKMPEPHSLNSSNPEPTRQKLLQEAHFVQTEEAYNVTSSG